MASVPAPVKGFRFVGAQFVGPISIAARSPVRECAGGPGSSRRMPGSDRTGCRGPKRRPQRASSFSPSRISTFASASAPALFTAAATAAAAWAWG